MSLSSMMAEDSKARQFRAPTDDELKSVGDLANEQLRLEKELEDQESKIKKTKESLAQVREHDLPDLLESIGLSDFKLTDGSSITVKEEVYAGITEENRDLAFKWLSDTGNDGIIKNEVKCPFGKGQDSEAKQLVDLLTAQGFSFTNSRSVHPQTLKAFVRKQMEDGKPVPTDVFSIHIKKISTVKQSKG